MLSTRFVQGKEGTPFGMSPGNTEWERKGLCPEAGLTVGKIQLNVVQIHNGLNSQEAKERGFWVVQKMEEDACPTSSLATHSSSGRPPTCCRGNAKIVPQLAQKEVRVVCIS